MPFYSELEFDYRGTHTYICHKWNTRTFKNKKKKTKCFQSFDIEGAIYLLRLNSSLKTLNFLNSPV